MDYAIHTLKNEARIIEKCLTGFDKDKYLEAFKIRSRRLKDIKEAADRLGLYIEVYGPETHVTDIVRMALEK